MGDHADDLIDSIIAPTWDSDGWEQWEEGVPPSQAGTWWAWGRNGLVIPDPDDYKLPRRQRRLLRHGLQNPKWNNEAFKKCLGRQTIIGLMIRPLKK